MPTPCPSRLREGGKGPCSVLLAEEGALDAERGVGGAVEEEGVAGLDPRGPKKAPLNAPDALLPDSVPVKPGPELLIVPVPS